MTNLMRWQQPDQAMHGLRRLFEKAKSAIGLSSRRGRERAITNGELLSERDGEYVVRVDLPGVREQDVDVQVNGDLLTISGEQHHEETKRERGYAYSVRSYGLLTRTIQLPRDVDPSRIGAELRDGVLEVHVPKGEAARARQIPITRRERQSGRAEPRVMAPGDGGQL